MNKFKNIRPLNTISKLKSGPSFQDFLTQGDKMSIEESLELRQEVTLQPLTKKKYISAKLDIKSYLRG
jgi:hypothetical protein